MNQNDRLPSRWLNSGWILEDERVAGERFFWIGLGDSETVPNREAGRDQVPSLNQRANLWVADFYAPSSTDFQPTLCRRISSVELSAVLTAFSGEVETSRVDWVEPSKEDFALVFEKMQADFRTDSDFEKAVPTVFSTGLARVDFNELGRWISHRLKSALVASQASSNLRLYGYWTLKGRGFLGLSPESLIQVRAEQNRLEATSCAVAATTLTAEGGPAASLNRDKEVHEHTVVIDGIKSAFQEKLGLEDVWSTEAAISDFGGLSHLRAEVRGELKRANGAWTRETFEAWVKNAVLQLHPTPALGVFPTTVFDQKGGPLEYLRELDRLGRSEKSGLRASQGAPFTFSIHLEDQSLRAISLVMIRRIVWAHDGHDELQIELGSGAGITAQSDFEAEWVELSNKREAVRRQLGLTQLQQPNARFTKAVLDQLWDFGLRHIVVCAGARNAPLVRALEKSKVGFQVTSHFDERSGAFYALGLARQHRDSRVAIITTSGTAAVECAPAVAEADYTQVPLWVITADRPRRLRHSGSPQTLNQIGLFQNFVGLEVDLEQLIDLKRLSPLAALHDRPAHLNVCYDEPLIDDVERAPQRLRDDRLSALSQTARPVVIVSGLKQHEVSSVRTALLALGLPVIAEGTSGLRGDPALSPLELVGPEHLHCKMLQLGCFNIVLRLGGVPTSRLWRDLEAPANRTRVVHVSSQRFRGLGFGTFHQLDLSDSQALTAVLTKEVSALGCEPHALERMTSGFVRESKTVTHDVQRVVEKNPKSELAFVYAASQLKRPSTQLYVGNSLAIRQWDLIADRGEGLSRERVLANRGVNGIDGQIASSLGEKQTDREMICILGDLTTLYDFSGLWALKLHQKPYRLIVLNNSGGQIFNRVASTRGLELCLNSHAMNFEHFSKAWGMQYTQIDSVEALKAHFIKSARGHELIEISPDLEQSNEVWKSIEDLVADPALEARLLDLIQTADGTVNDVKQNFGPRPK